LDPLSIPRPFVCFAGSELSFGAIPHGDVDVGPLQPVDAPTSSQDDDR
jgi:hypothetical protein